MTDATINYVPVPPRFSRLAIAAGIWILLIFPLGFAIKAWVLDTHWFLAPYWVVTTRSASDPGTWYTQFSPRQWFFAALLLLELTGFLLGLLACYSVKSNRLRGRGLAMNAMFAPVFLMMCTIMAYPLIEALDWHLGR
jgi:hypothetical protein